MIPALALLLLFQLSGETLARGLGLPVPGPVLGLAGLFALLVLRPSVREAMKPTTDTILGHLSLLFVPAGVGVIAHMDTFGQNGPALLVALIVSTGLAIVAGAAVFGAVARLMGTGEDNGDE